LDLICTAVVVVFVTNVIYFSEEIKAMPVGKKMSAKTIVSQRQHINIKFIKGPSAIRGN
jgi:hypothetical protein